MKDFEGVLALQVDSIVANLRHLQEERSRRLLRQAESQARELRRATRRKLHMQGREAVRDERRRREKALRMAGHRIRAEAGQRMQVLYTNLLRDGWPALIDELERRWSNPDTRASWCDMVADRALEAFGPTAWTIEHPAEWMDADGERLCHALAKRGVPPATFALDASATAGLRVRHGTACLDATIDGLLSERARVEGRLLAEWEQASPGAGQDD
jgi:vacuolar-type H+-ATPase subunit H